MASVEPVTLAIIQQDIHTLFSNGTDFPAPDEEDYQVRTSLSNSVIRTWENLADEEGIDWRSLFDVKTGQVVSAAGDTTYPCDTSQRRPSGRITLALNGELTKVPIISMERLDNDNLPTTYAFVSGKPGAYVLNLVGVPAQWVGAAIRYRFYRFATKLAAPTDVPDMSNPNFIIFSVVAILFQLAHNNTGYTIYANKANAARDGMVTANTRQELGEEEDAVPSRINNFGTMGS